MPPLHHKSLGPTRQRGVISILTAALLMALLLVMVIVLDGGRLYLEKRQLQNIADMAALSAFALGTCDETTARRAAEKKENGFDSDKDSWEDINCDNGRFDATATRETPTSLILGGMFGGDTRLTAHASAQRNEPIAAFTVSSRLLSLNNDKLVGRLLENVGLEPEKLEILSSEALLSTSITPAGLLSSLGIDVSIDNLGLLTPQSLLAVSGLSVNDIIDASLEFVDFVDNETDRDDLEELSEDIADSSLNSIDLLGSNGLVRLTSGNREQTRAALDTEINLGELLSLAVITGTGEKSLEIPALKLLGVNISAGITSPPALAIGPATAIDADGNITYPTQAHTGQLRLSLNFDTEEIPVVKILLGLLDTRIYLPLTIDVARANATLTDINCEAEPPTVDIDVSSSLLEVCVGDMPQTGDPLWLSSQSCSAIATRTNTDLIRLLGITLLGPSKLILGAPDVNNHYLPPMAVGGEPSSYVHPNALPLGTMVANLLAGLLDDSTTSSNNQLLAKSIATKYLKASASTESEDSSYELYDPNKAASLILHGGIGNNFESLEALATKDWFVPNYKINNAGALFSDAFKDMSNNGGFLGLRLVPNTVNNYESCGVLFNDLPDSLLDGLVDGIGDLLGGLLGGIFGRPSHKEKLLTAISNYNKCVEKNLTLLLQRKPGGLDLDTPEENADLDTPEEDADLDTPEEGADLDTPEEGTNCAGFLCNLLRAPLDNVSNLLTGLISESLGLELGRADIRVESINCGVPTLVE